LPVATTSGAPIANGVARHSRPTPFGATRLRLRLCSETDPAAARAAEQTLIDLGDRLSSLIGSDGYRALIGRALNMAAEDFPVLKGVQPALDPPGRLAGLPPVVRGSKDGDGKDAIVGTLAALLWLLEQFIGKDLTRQIVGDVCPAVYTTMERAQARR
jgi:hypothetical protein